MTQPQVDVELAGLCSAPRLEGGLVGLMVVELGVDLLEVVLWKLVVRMVVVVELVVVGGNWHELVLLQVVG